jgi:diguanylate cyclase
MQESLEAARFESLTDPLTALANRKHFDMALERLMRSASEQRRPLALLLGDIDHFKSFNDKHGHQTGDQVLRLVAAALRQVITEADLAARYGGEDFAIILPDTSLRDALVLAEQARLAVMAKDLVKRSTGERLGRITMSLGVAVLQPQDTPESLIARADVCLYAAKAAGRNCIKSDDELRRTGGRRDVA